MNLTKSQCDKPLNENNWGGTRLECTGIQKRADQWCKDNGYPLIKRKYVYKGKWKLVDIQR